MSSKRWIIKSSLVLVIFLFYALVFTKDIKLVFAGEGKRVIALEEGEPKIMPAVGREFTASTITVSVPDDKFENMFVVVHDVNSGNVAVRKVSEIAPSWKLSDEDWKIGKVVVEAKAGENLLSSGLAKLKSGRFEASELIVNGKAEFFAVPQGDGEVVVQYTVGANREVTPPVYLKFELQRDEPVLIVNVLIPENAGGIAGAIEKPSEETKIEHSQRPRNMFVEVTIWLVTLAVGIGVLILVFYLLKSKQPEVVDKLRKLGIEPPSPPEDVQIQDTSGEPFALESEPLTPPGHCPYCGNAFAEDGTCACSSKVSSSAPPAVASVLVRARLVGEGGLTFDIPDGVNIIGREGDIVIQDATVSRKHAQITKQDNSVFIKDLGSSNGTYINGMKIENERELHSGDTVQFGTVRMRFEG